MISHLLGTFHLFSPLLDFEPDLTKDRIKRAKKRIKSLDSDRLSIEELLAEFKEYPVFLVALGIVYESLESIHELSNPISTFTKEMQRFKSNDKYLNRYINSFQDTAQLYKNLDRQNDVEELEEIIRIFQHVKNKDTRHQAIQWLITEYLTYILVGDVSFEELFPDLPKSLTKTRDDANQKALSRRVNVYSSYFDGFDISKEDIYRSMQIKLFHLYANYASNQGRGDANPNTHIEPIIEALQGKSIKISPTKMVNIYIKGFCFGFAVFDYKKNLEQKDAIDEYFKLQQQSVLAELFPFSEELILKQRQQLLSQLILL